MTDADAAGAAPARDPGLQGERTALAWNRTALALAVNGLVVLRAGWLAHQAAVTIVGAILLVASGAAVLYGAMRGRALAGHTAHVPVAAPVLAVALTTAVAVLACAAGIAAVLLTR